MICTHPLTLPVHALEPATLPLAVFPAYAATIQHHFNPQPPPTPLAYTDVYIDDFMVVAQPPMTQPVMRALLHSIDAIFADPPDSVRHQVISASKLAKGDAQWSCQKRILGWDVDTAMMTLSLPPYWQEWLV